MINTDSIKNVVSELYIAIVLYFAGFLTNELWDILTKKKKERKIQTNTRLALEAIYEAEEKFKKFSKSGADKLEYAAKQLMRTAKIKRYQAAQEQIIQVFTITKLSK